MNIIIPALSFIFGTLIGSFINVCIYRIPRDESIVSPGSRCPRCHKDICWHDNIPVVSYLFLRGKCRFCGGKISPQYPLVELLTGMLFLLLGLKFGAHPITIVYFVVTFVLVCASGIDYYHKVIPDVFSLSLVCIGLAVSPVNGTLGLDAVHRVLNSAAGLLLGGGILFVIAFLGEKVFRKESMGGGDIKLLAGIGAILGWEKVVTTLFFASLLGSVMSLALIFSGKINRKDYIPFGPFLAAAAYANIFLPVMPFFFPLK